MTDRELLEKILDNQVSMQNQINGLINHINNNQNSMQNQINGLINQINNNHSEVIVRLTRLEENQNAIKEFILNSDDTFKKSEEAYRVIQKFKEAFSK